MANGQPVPGSVYFYAPNKIAPAFFAVAFLASGVLHVLQSRRYKSFTYTSYFPLCALFFTVGFAVREYGAFDYGHLGVYIASTTFIYMSPPILEMANYHVLGRILYYVPYCSPLHPGRVLTTFGFLSGVVEVLNAIGVAYTANSTLPQRILRLGLILMKTSLILQLIVISIFSVMAGSFHLRCVNVGVSQRIRTPLLVLYCSMTLIFIRTVYRTVEHFGVGNILIALAADPEARPTNISPIVRYEWFFWVFEGVPMVLNTFIWNLWHPGRFLPQSYKTYLALDGTSELQGPGWGDNRHWLATLVDPLGLFLEKGGKETPFWEMQQLRSV